jgi:hypothetical protein
MHDLLTILFLFKFLSWLPWQISDWWTFGTFISLGLVQAIVSVFGGNLAVRSLPHGVGIREKRKSKRYFRLLGSLLFILTCVIGYLNDRSQFQLNGKLDRTNTALNTITTGFTTLGNRLSAQIELANPVTSKSNTATDVNEYVAKVLDLAKTQLKSASQANAPLPILPHPSVVQAPPPLGNQFPTPSVTQSAPFQANPIAELGGRIDSLVGSLRTSETELNHAGMLFKSQLMLLPSNFPRPFSEAQMVASMTASIKKRDDAYEKQYLPQIEDIRTKAHVLYAMSPIQISDDDAKFSAANSEAMKTTQTEGLTSRQLFPLMFIPKYYGMISYLNNLKIPPTTSK